MRDGDAARVLHVYAYRRLVPARGNQALLDGEGSDAGQNIAAVLAVADVRLIDHDLQKEIVHICIVSRRGAHDGHLAGQRMRAAEPIDLARVG